MLVLIDFFILNDGNYILLVLVVDRIGYILEVLEKVFIVDR